MTSPTLDTILHGDCLTKMTEITPNTVDLIYLDPPFFTESKQKMKGRLDSKDFSFDDKWTSHTSYANFIKERLHQAHICLKDNGSIFVHCDKHAQHIIRGVLDEVFGSENFQSEIIWSYKRWSNAKMGLLPSHQNIYFYSKSATFNFNRIYTNYSSATNIDQIQQRRKRDITDKSVYDRDAKGNSKQGAEKKGVPLGDVWDIPYLNPKAKERVGYPTQKPIVLLERIINLVTQPGDIVLDPFCGSGTTCVAANLLGRRYIGIDQSLDAVQLSQARLANPVKTQSLLLDKGREISNKEQDKISGLLAGIDYHLVNRNNAIDAILVEHYQDSPVLVRVQKEHECLTHVATILKRAMKVKGAKKAILIQTRSEPLTTCQTLASDGLELVPCPALKISLVLNQQQSIMPAL